MKKLLLILLIPSVATASQITNSLAKMYCTGYADAVHTSLYSRGPSDKILAEYAKECEKDPNGFSRYMEIKAIQGKLK